MHDVLGGLIRGGDRDRQQLAHDRIEGRMLLTALTQPRFESRLKSLQEWVSFNLRQQHGPPHASKVSRMLRIGKQRIDDSCPFVRGLVVEECADFGGGRNASDQVQTDSPQELSIVGQRGRFDVLLIESLRDLPIDISRNSRRPRNGRLVRSAWRVRNGRLAIHGHDADCQQPPLHLRQLSRRAATPKLWMSRGATGEGSGSPVPMPLDVGVRFRTCLSKRPPRADLRQSAIHALRRARATPRDTVRKAHFSSCRSPSANVGRHACMIPRTDGLAKRPAPATQHADIQTLILLKKGVGFTLACEIVEDLSGGPPVPSGRAINRAASRWPVSSSLFALPPIRDAGRHRGLRRDAMDSSNRAGTALRLVCRGLRQRRAAVA